jgi:hypothetical protein
MDPLGQSRRNNRTIMDAQLWQMASRDARWCLGYVFIYEFNMPIKRDNNKNYIPIRIGCHRTRLMSIKVYY